MAKKIIIIVGDLSIFDTDYGDERDSLQSYIQEKISPKVLVESVYSIAHFSTHWRKLKSVIEYIFSPFTNLVKVYHTHNLDEIKVIAELWAEGKYDFSFYRIQKRRDGNIIHVDYDLEILQTSLESNIEFR